MPFIQFQHRRDTPLNWFTANTILAAGEMGLEVGNDLFKIGDGIRPWNSLPYGGLRGVTGATGGGVDLSTLNPIAIGVGAGATGQVINAIAIGPYAGATGQKNSAIAIGIAAGQINQGNNAIAIGASAGYTGQAANTIILNASGSPVNGVSGQTGSFYVAPVRASTSSYVLGYDPSTFEITYAIPAASGATGATATVSVGTVTTLAPGSAATVTDVGTSYASILNFGIPQGATGGGTGGITFSGPSGSVLYYDGTSVTGSSFFTFDGTTGGTGEVTISGKLTVLGGIDPLYLNLVPVASNPLVGTTGTLWVNSTGKLNLDNAVVGSTDLTTLNPIAIGISAGYTGQQTQTVAIGYLAGNGYQQQDAISIGTQAGFTGQQYASIAIGTEAGFTGQQIASIAIGYLAGNDTQNTNAVAIGALAGAYNQKTSAVALGYGAGYTGQQQGAIAIGPYAGNNSQAANTIILNASGAAVNGVSGQTGSFYVAPVRSATSSYALGYNPVTFEITYAIPAASGATGATATVSVGTVTTLAPGSAATVTDVGTSYASILNFGIPQGATGGGTGGITFSGPSGSVLYYDGTSVTGSSFFTFNGTTGATGEVTISGKLTVLGGIDPLYLNLVPTSTNPFPGVTGTLWVDTAGKLQYDNTEVAVAGISGGVDLSTLDPIAIGVSAGEAGQSSSAVAIGFQAGQTSQGGAAVAIGNQAGQKTQGMDAIAIGNLAGNTGQQGLAIAIGRNAGEEFQQNASIAIGAGAGNVYQQQEAISIGMQAGNTGQQQGAIAIGYLAGNDTQNTNAVAIGYEAGAAYQQQDAISIGTQAGYTGQQSNAIAIGAGAGKTTQGELSVAVGNNAGSSSQGVNAVAIGAGAGETNQAANTIILNASGTEVNGEVGQTGSFYVTPVRSATSSNVLGYDPVTSEITYYAAPVGATGEAPTSICATAYSTSSQSFTTNISENIQHDAVAFAYGITVTTGPTGYFEVPSAGVYKIIPSLQINPSGNGHLHVWLKMNDINVDNTGTYLAFKPGEYQVFTTEILLELEANDKVQVWAQPSVAGGVIQSFAAGGTPPNDYPAAPGIITNMYKLRDASAPV